MHYAKIQPITCEEILRRHISDQSYKCVINEMGRTLGRNDKIMEGIYEIFKMIIQCDDIDIYSAKYIHGQTIFTKRKKDNIQYEVEKAASEIFVYTEVENKTYFDERELVDIFPFYNDQASTGRSNFPNSTWFEFVKNLGDLSFAGCLVLDDENTTLNKPIPLEQTETSCSAIPVLLQEDISTPPRPKPGGSNKDTTRSEPTMIAAQNVFRDIQRHTDSNGKIALDEFCSLVMVSMKAQGVGGLFHQEECKKWARKNLGQHKLGRGEKICKIKQ